MVSALVAQQRWQTPGTDDDLTTAAPEQALVDLIAHFTTSGLLETGNPRLTADHFGALTILMAYNEQPDPTPHQPPPGPHHHRKRRPCLHARLRPR